MNLQSVLSRLCTAFTLILFAAPAIAAEPSIQWSGRVVKQKPEWYASPEARALAESVIQHQSPQGGWPREFDPAAPPVSQEGSPPPERIPAGTFDNGATTLQMHFLALMVQATGDEACRSAFERGLECMLAAQYPNGGVPQSFPLREGYPSHITYNDHVMIRVLTVLRDAAAGQEPYAFVSEELRAKAAEAVAKGIECILRTQVRQDDKLTAWCAQHGQRTLVPSPARAFEPASLSGCETVGIVRFLMSIEQPAPEIIAAIEGAVEWLQAVAIPGVRVEEFTGEDGERDRRIVADPAAGPLWARFYDLETNRPVFTGRDRVVRRALSQIERERRMGYGYYGAWAAKLLERDYPRWRKRHQLP